jgi:hypothetical protein
MHADNDNMDLAYACIRTSTAIQQVDQIKFANTQHQPKSRHPDVKQLTRGTVHVPCCLRHTLQQQLLLLQQLLDVLARYAQAAHVSYWAEQPAPSTAAAPLLCWCRTRQV